MKGGKSSPKLCVAPRVSMRELRFPQLAALLSPQFVPGMTSMEFETDSAKGKNLINMPSLFRCVICSHLSGNL